MFSGSQCICVIVSNDIMDLFLDFRLNLLFWTHPVQLHSWWTLSNQLFCTPIHTLSYHFPSLCNQVACLILFQNWKEISIDTFCYDIEKSMTYLAWPYNELVTHNNHGSKTFLIILSLCNYSLFPSSQLPQYTSKCWFKGEVRQLKQLYKKQMVSLSIKRCKKPICYPPRS